VIPPAAISGRPRFSPATARSARKVNGNAAGPPTAPSTMSPSGARAAALGGVPTTSASAPAVAHASARRMAFVARTFASTGSWHARFRLAIHPPASRGLTPAGSCASSAATPISSSRSPSRSQSSGALPASATMTGSPRLSQPVTSSRRTRRRPGL